MDVEVEVIYNIYYGECCGICYNYSTLSWASCFLYHEARVK